MTKTLIAMAGLLGILACRGLADEIDSKVVHHYTYFGGGFGYLHDLGDSGIDAYGPFAEASFEEQNFVLHAVGGHFWGDELSLRTWSVGASMGYVVRLMENHVNIIPRFGGAYGRTRIEVGGSEFEGDAWAIAPGVTLSYAINNRLALQTGYTYVYNLDAEDGDHVFGVGGQFALFERVGLNVGASFSKETGFDAITTGIEFHF